MLKVVPTADLHVGHKDGLTLPFVKFKDGGGYEASEEQLRLYGVWCEAAAGPWHRPDVLVLNGDIIDGQGRKDSGVEQWTTDVDAQVDTAIELVKMWDARKVYVVRGTDYHSVVNGISFDEIFASKFKAQRIKNQGPRSHWELYLRFEDVTFHFAHKSPSAGSLAYKSTGITRQMLKAKVNDAMRHDMDKFNHTKIIVRAHSHFYCHVDFSSQEGFNLPAFQLKSPYMTKNDPHGFVPDVGYIGLEIDGENVSYKKYIQKLEKLQEPPFDYIDGRRGKRK